MVAEQIEVGTGRTGGRDATTGVIPGRFALSVGMPESTPPKGWKWTPLSSVAQLESGHTPSRKHPEYWDGGIPWIGIKDATENHGRTIQDTYQHVSELGLENSSARLLPANTVCLSRTASVGFVVVMGRPMATSQDFVNWVCGPHIDPHFLKYVLLAENEALWRFASGTTHQTIYYPEAKAFHVCLPPLTEQKAIARVLGALDDKIELNRWMNATLEAMARALFQSWFVNFDPVRAKLDGHQPTGLDKATAALFPASFQESRFGSIPAGWSIAALAQLCEKITDGAHQSPKSVAKGFPMASVKDMTNWEIDIPGCRHISPEDFESLVANGCQPQGGDVLLAKDGATCLDTACEYQQPEKIVLLSSVAILRPRNIADAGFLHTWLGLESTKQYLKEGFVSGSAIPRVVLRDMKRAELVVPPRSILDAFASAVSPLRTQIRHNAAQSRTLAILRDTLLPKLLNGELPLSTLREKVTV